jgi:Zn-finger protein
MPVTQEQAREIESKASHFGCGRHDCLDCYPLQYRCEDCGEEFWTPILNGERYECPECDWVNNADW